MCSSIRLAVFLFTCFAALTVVNSTLRNNSATSEYEVEKGNSSLEKSPENSLLNRRSRQVQQPWCEELYDRNLEEILANCQMLKAKDSDYVLRVGPNVNKEAWKNFTDNLIQLDVHVEIDDTSLTELNLQLGGIHEHNLTIINNQRLKTINITTRSGSTLNILGSLDIRRNPALTSINIETDGAFSSVLRIRENSRLEKFVLDTHRISILEDNKIDGWYIERNPKLRHIDLSIQETFWIYGPVYVRENKALSQLLFPEFLREFVVSDMKITNNANLERIRIPTTNWYYIIYNLEIRKNPKLTSIELEQPTAGSIEFRHLTVRDNPSLNSTALDPLKTIGETRDIQ